MGRLTSLFLLSVVAATALGGALYLVNRDQFLPDSEYPRPFFTDLSAIVNQSVSITVRDRVSEVEIKRRSVAAERWTIPQKQDYPADFLQIKRGILSLNTLQALEERTNNPRRLKQLHLQDLSRPDSQARQVIIRDENQNNLLSFLIGKPASEGRDTFFIRLPDRPQTWLAQGPLEFSSDPLDWIDDSLPVIPYERVQRVIIQHPDGERLIIGRVNVEEETFAVTVLTVDDPPYETETTDMRTFLSYFYLDDVSPQEAIAFDQDPVTTTLDMFDGLIVVIQTVEHQTRYWMHIRFSVDPFASQETEEEALRLNRRYDRWAFQISPYLATRLRSRGSDFE